MISSFSDAEPAKDEIEQFLGSGLAGNFSYVMKGGLYIGSNEFRWGLALQAFSSLL